MARLPLLELLNHTPPARPITMMFAADFAGIPYGQYALDHRKMSDAHIRTVEHFDLDFVSASSDPFGEAADCGTAAHFFNNQPPAIDETNPYWGIPC